LDESEENVSEKITSNILVSELSKYSLIRPEKVSEGVRERINTFYNELNEKFNIADYKDDFHRDDVPKYQIGEYEIIVGNADREETREFLTELRCEDYGYVQMGKKIIIAGHSDENVINAIEKFVDTIVSKTEASDEVFYKSEYDYVNHGKYKISSVYIENVFAGKYRIVYPEKNENSEKKAAVMISDAIRKASGIVVNVISDKESEANGYEILVGATNRNTDEEIADMSEKLLDIESVIKSNGKNVNVFGKNYTSIMVATNEFLSKLEGDNMEKLEISFENEQTFMYDDTTLWAMSFNVWIGGKNPERDERVVEMVRKYSPDTVGFQEVDSGWLSVLNAGLGNEYDFVGEGRDGGSKGEYNPIFYKKAIFTLLESGTRWLSSTPEVVSKVEESTLNRIYTYALLERKSDGSRIMVINTHFEHTSDKPREKQAEVLVKMLESVTEYPVILTGDFNCESSSIPFSKVVSGGVVNSFDLADDKINSTATFTNYGSANLTIDFVFVSPKGIDVNSYKVCNEKINGNFPSDHHPVLIEYELDKNDK
jgi:endonuclease/exonuclease/phosphatase family metal-dependent hydrolase